MITGFKGCNCEDWELFLMLSKLALLENALLLQPCLSEGRQVLQKQKLCVLGPLHRRMLVCSANAAASGHSSPSGEEVALLEKLLRWPAASLFPALDVTRLLLLHEPTAAHLAGRAGPLELSPIGMRLSRKSVRCWLKLSMFFIFSWQAAQGPWSFHPLVDMLYVFRSSSCVGLKLSMFSIASCCEWLSSYSGVVVEWELLTRGCLYAPQAHILWSM